MTYCDLIHLPWYDCHKEGDYSKKLTGALKKEGIPYKARATANGWVILVPDFLLQDSEIIALNTSSKIK